MCGIAGRWGLYTGLHPETRQLLNHRGPDDWGQILFSTRAGRMELLQTRLAILDPSSAGHQPMSTADGRYTIVLNGEIYNFRALRRELQASTNFQSQTDTEVVLQGFLHWGEELFAKLDGMFALGIWDAKTETLVLARDGLGIKPLYIAEEPSKGLTFASELKVLLRQPGINRTLRVESIAEYLTFLWIPEPHTMFQYIDKLPAGHYAIYRAGRRQGLYRYYDFKSRFASKQQISDADIGPVVRDTLAAAIRSHMVSDVPIGAFFSGGLDSTAIIAEMARESSSPVMTETVGFHPKDQKYDIAPSDVLYARHALSQLPRNLDYHETFLEDASLDLLPEIVRWLDDPIGDPAAISTLLIARAVQPRARVMLSGMGAEEIWGGYARYWATLSAMHSWGKLPSSTQKITRTLLSYMPSSQPWPMMGMLRQAKKYCRASGTNMADIFITFESYLDREDLPNALMPTWCGADPWARHLELFRDVEGLDPLDQMAYVDAMTFLPSLNLAYTDRASMAASIEVRVPFLSSAMVDLAAQLPSSARLYGRIGKYGIRKAAGLMGVPEDIIARKKSGFGAPVRAWMARQHHPLIQELLDEDVIRRRGVVNPAYVMGLRQRHRSGREDYGLQLYALMVLEQWFRTYVDDPSVLFDATTTGGDVVYGN